MIGLFLSAFFAIARALAFVIQPVATLLGRLRAASMPVLHPTRAILTLVTLYSLALILTAQGRELVYSLDVDADWVWVGRWALLIVVMVWTAIQAWWWARVQLTAAENAARDANQPPLPAWPKEWVPRLYALAIFAAPAIACIFPSQLTPSKDLPSWGEVWHAWLVESHWRSAIAMSVLGFAMFTFLKMRTGIAARRSGSMIATLLDDPAGPKGTVAGRNVPPLFANFTRSGLTILALSFVVALAMLLLQRFAPVGVGRFFGSLSLALIGVASLIPVLGALTIGETMSRAPVMTALLVIALGLSIIRPLDHHAIQPLPESQSVAQPYPDLAKALQAWETANPPSGDKPAPMVLVYTAGGGIRAAYWTVAILNYLEQHDAAFHKRVFAISGVSGGSVGAVFWTAALNNVTSGCAVAAGDPKQLTRSLREDHLASAVGALLYNDLFHAVLPIEDLWRLPLDLPREDRAFVLESTWADSFKRNTGSDCLNAGFNTLWSNLKPDEWRPLLLINGTHQESGRRVITSPLQISEQNFPDSLDFFHLFGRDIRASTAALNSARFTYVSAAGRIEGPDGRGNMVQKGHLLDGGYFENYGARTIRDLMVALDKLQAGNATRHPIILLEIVNDTDLSDDAARRIIKSTEPEILNEAEAPRWFGYGLINEIAAPIQALANVRGAHGVAEAKLTMRNFESRWSEGASWWANRPTAFQSGSFVGGTTAFLLRLCPVHPIPPLGWVLNPESANTMDGLIDGTKAGDCANVHGNLDAIIADVEGAWVK